MAKPSERKAFLLYYNVFEVLGDLEPAEAWETLAALVEYSRSGVLPELKNPYSKAVFRLQQTAIDRDNEKYAERCRINAENGRRGGRGNKREEQASPERQNNRPESWLNGIDEE